MLESISFLVKMERRKNITNEDIAQTYKKKAGNLSATASSLNISRQTLINWRADDKELEGMMHDVEESLLDFSESKLMQSIQEGNLTAIIFHLKTKGKRRGYVEQVDSNISMNPFEKLMQELDKEESET
jgi:histone H3/H4